jgi:hypothetical protein
MEKTNSSNGRARSDSNKRFDFFEELISHHLRDPVQHALTDTRDQAADFGVGAVFEHGSTVRLL